MGILSAFRFAFQNLFFTPILYGVIASLAVFSSVWETGDRLKDQLTDRYRSHDDTFDFIIVGGGSAGAVLANRLSQFHTVLLLESGGETHPFQAIPGLAIFIPKHRGTDWMHKSVTQTNSCLSCPHKKYILSQGKNLGGSGNLNYMIHMRGNPLDFDNWATITGDPTWGYDGVLPYFIQSENFVGETTDKDAHGHGGPLQIQLPDCIGLANEWNAAGVEMGYSHVDLNGRHSEGFDTVFYPIKRGVRQATYRSYIQPVRNRLSLLIRKFAHVNKVLIREGTNEAYGVEYDRHGHKKNAFANKEVILSAGTLQTPKLLILSGVGQLEHLNALHIPVRSVLPVGKNLQDHFSTLLGPFYINKAKTISFDRDIDKQSFVRFAVSGKGPLSTTGFMATAVVASSIAKAEGQGSWPDLQLTLFGLTPHRMFYSDIGHAFGIRQDILHRYYGDVQGKENAFFIMVTLARPESKGDFCLPTKDPYKPAAIDPNYLMDAQGHDVKVMIEGIQRALFLAENTTAFQALETCLSPKCFPGCENVPFRSDAYWECYIRHFSVATNDHVGTCPMGKVGSPYAVVDPELRVQGVKRLRVVDASVMPTIVGAPTQAATIMIGEKASALILNEWVHEAKSFYGPPGVKPGTPVQQYGPPLANSLNSQYGPPANTLGPQYGPPANNLGPQYGPPGLKPPPVAGGDGFENYDSFSVISDQFNPKPNGAPAPTALIPINPNTQLWSTPSPFPSAVGGTPGPPFISGATAQPPVLTPEPSVVLLPPGSSLNGPGPTFATSYSTSNIDFSGSIVSSTPNYPVNYLLDTSRSEQTPVFGEARVGLDSNVTGSRQGKSFPESSSTVSPSPEGNQLGPGLDEEALPLSTPTPSPAYFSTPAATSPSSTQEPQTDVTETEVITQGPGFKVVRKRIRTTPRVVVHPRGHLGHQNVQRQHKELNETLESLFLTTSSIRPVPKDFVKIKRRRPVPNRKRTTTTRTPYDTTLREEEGVTVFSSNGIEFSTTSRPFRSASLRTELPLELKSPGKKRFVRRMYTRPLNFNGKRFGGGRSQNEFIARATSPTPITVTYDAGATENSVIQQEIEERIDLDTAASVEREAPTTSDLLIEETDEETIQQNATEPSGTTTTTATAKSTLEEGVTPQPVIVFENIELEDVQALNRQTRRINSSEYFHYNFLAEEKGKNPIMPVDLSPIPKIFAPEAGRNAEAHETVAVDLSGEIEEESETADGDGDDYEGSYDEDEEDIRGATDKPNEPVAKQLFLDDKKQNNNTSSSNSSDSLEAENQSFLSTFHFDSQEDLLDEKQQPNVNMTSNSSIIRISSSSSYTIKNIPPVSPSPITNNNFTSTPTPASVKEKETSKEKGAVSCSNSYVRVETSKSIVAGSSSSPSTSSPRVMFRARNKLIRIHS